MPSVLPLYTRFGEVVVENTTAEKSILVPDPADSLFTGSLDPLGVSLAPGDLIQIEARGRMKTKVTNPGKMWLICKWNGDPFCDSHLDLPANVLEVHSWVFRATFTFADLGQPILELKALGEFFVLEKNFMAQVGLASPRTVSSKDANSLDLRVRWDLADAANIIRLLQCQITHYRSAP